MSDFDNEMVRDIHSLVRTSNYRDWTNPEDRVDQKIAEDFRATPVKRHVVREEVSESQDGLPVKDRDLIDGTVDANQLGDELVEDRVLVERSGEVQRGKLRASSKGAGVPEGNVRQVLAWVDGDEEKARKALDAENAKENPRKSLVSQLEEVIGD